MKLIRIWYEHFPHKVPRAAVNTAWGAAFPINKWVLELTMPPLLYAQVAKTLCYMVGKKKISCRFYGARSNVSHGNMCCRTLSLSPWTNNGLPLTWSRKTIIHPCYQRTCWLLDWCNLYIIVRTLVCTIDTYLWVWTETLLEKCS